MCIDPERVRWVSFETFYFTEFHREWFSKKLNVSYKKTNESLLTNEVVNDYGLDCLARNSFGFS